MNAPTGREPGRQWARHTEHRTRARRLDETQARQDKALRAGLGLGPKLIAGVDFKVGGKPNNERLLAALGDPTRCG